MSRKLIGALMFLMFLSAMYSESLHAQVYQTQGTRRGAVVGGIIGGVIGANNDRPVAGIVAGAVVGGLLGREIGRQRDGQFYQQQYQQQYHRPYYQGSNWQSQSMYSNPQFQNYPTYNVPRQNFYGPRQYYVPPQQPRNIRYGW